MKKNFPYRFILLYICLHVCGQQFPIFAQQNLVPNGSFEDISDCDFDYGDIDHAPPWQAIDYPLKSPDLYHACAVNPFYQIPEGSCFPVYPKDGEGMAGMVHLQSDERISIRLTDTLPMDVDIYVSYSIIPRIQCPSPTDFFCKTNTPGFVFTDFDMRAQKILLEKDEVFSNEEGWETLQTCYSALGWEELVLLGNYRLTSETKMECANIDPEQNFAYFFVDDVIVSPFDVVPDTLLLCENENIEVNISFWDLPIRWGDGPNGGNRLIDAPGHYEVFGQLPECALKDETEVIFIPENRITVPFDLCKNSSIFIESPTLARWPSGDTSQRFEVVQPGQYEAVLFTPCGERTWVYDVIEKPCSVEFFVGNILDHSDSNGNNTIDFHFTADFEYVGDLNVFDRWGNLTFQKKNISAADLPQWDGLFNSKKAQAGVYLWSFDYLIKRTGKRQRISGDITVIH